MAKIPARRFLSAYLETLRPHKSVVLIVLILAIFLTYWASSYVPVGPPHQVEGVLQSVEPPHGGDPLYQGFDIRLANEKSVTIFLPKSTPVRVGRNVIIEVQPTLFGGESYRFIAYQGEAPG